ncbi:Imm1 family immunity protein [Actinosynnema sp. NPDC059335]|uniref:Imm1 family immunity protein n=1 Tax=Actinosynnema sp. NPDC059335 TaxID=3346804 RepID=UPI003672C8E5
MASLMAWYKRGEEPTPITSAADLDALLERMAADFAAQDGPVPPMAELARPDPWAQGWVAIRLGIAPDRGFIAHADATGSYITTNGSDPDGEPVLYDHQAHAREWPSDAELPLADVIKAAHDLVATDGERSTTVNWRPWDL